jgi:hypothetical protein
MEIRLRARWLVPLVIFAGLAIYELRKPADQRTWHGEIAGVVPYDLRPPSIERVRRSLWDPESERLLTPQVFGVGWAINLGRLARLVGLR